MHRTEIPRIFKPAAALRLAPRPAPPRPAPPPQTPRAPPQVPAAGYVSVSLYVDDRGSAKELPLNARASALVSGPRRPLLSPPPPPRPLPRTPLRLRPRPRSGPRKRLSA